MPPEPLPWDRKDFRKHDRSASDARLGAGGLGGGGGGPPHKWREQQHHPHAPASYHQQQRWYSDFRSPRLLPPGHNKQGGWPMYSEDTGRGFMPLGSRYAGRNLEDENCRPFGFRGDGRYSRNNRENRGFFTQKDWKAPSWEPAAVPNAPREPIAEVNNLRSIENTQPCDNRSGRSSYASHPLSSVSLSDQSQSLFLVEEKNGGTTDEMTDKVQESEKENCLESGDWEPLKRSRVSSLSTRSSCISHSTSAKSLGLDSIEVLAEVQPENATLDQSPSVDVACVRSNAPAQSDETGSRKKPRLGWGEGLAKYEKKKVEGPEDGTSKNELDLSAISSESPLSQSANLLEKSPILESFWDCASPATPSSAACSSSPGVVEEKSVKDTNVDQDTANVSCFPIIASLGHYGGPTLNLENLELESIANLSSLINELVQPNAPNSAETGYMQTTSMNKLLVWKVGILKALEMTESEIESLETEFKSLIDESEIHCSHPASPRSLAGEQQSKPCEVLDSASICGVWQDTSQIVSSGEMIVKDAPVGLDGGHVLSKDENIDSPGSATSKFVDVQPAIFHSKKAKFSEGAKNVDVGNFGGLDEKCLKNIFSYQESSAYVNNLVLNGHTSCEDLVGISKVYCNVDSIRDSILSSNREAVGRALEQLNKLLPQQCLFGSSIESIVSMQRNSSGVKEKFLKRKQFLQFKEKVLTLKFKVFQHFWKEGRLVSIKTLRGKARKKVDPCPNGQKRNRSRVSSYAGGPQAVPADEVIKFVNDFLSQLAFKPYRNTLKMPTLILDKQVKLSRFISNNGLVEDPCAVEKERSMMNPWTAVETEIFMEKLAAFGKDFRKIASFLDHRTVADCIEFYYKNHKSKCFEETRNNYGFVKQRKSQTTYLVASGKRRNPELNAASLDILGAASEIVAKIGDGIDIWQKCPSRSSFGVSNSCGAPGIVDHLLKGSNSMDVDNDERETEAADVLAGICGSLSSEAMSSSITSSVDLGDSHQDPRCPRICPSIKRPSAHEVTQDADGEFSDESCGELNPCDWSDEEKSIFIQAMSSYGKDFVMVSQCVRTKSMDQCKVFFSKAKKCLGLDLIQPGAGTASGDVDGGGSDIDDGCAMETCSDICNNGSECDMREDFSPPGMKLNHESDMVNMVPDFKTSKGNKGLGPLDSTTARLLLENSSTVGSNGDYKPVTDFNKHGEGQNGTDDISFVPVQEPQTVAVDSNIESEQRVEKEENLGMAHQSNEVENRSSVKVSDGYCAEENQCQGPLLPEDNLCGRDANSNDVNDITSGIRGEKFEPQIAGSVSHASIDAHSSAQVDKKSDNPKKADVGTCSAENSRVGSLLQNGRLASATSSTLFSVPIKYKKTPNHSPLLPVDASRVNDTHSQNIVSTGDSQQHLPSYSLNSTESFQILQGYPVSLQTVKGTNGDVSCEKLTPLPNVPVRDENLNSDRHADFLLQRYKEARQSNVAFPPLERGRDHSRSQSGSLSVGEKTPRNGDVKLFGKILSSSQQKPNESAEDNSSRDHRIRLESLNLKVSSEQKASFDFRQSKLDCNNYVPAENMPVRRFGFWDGNRIQTGTPLSPMPDSALLLAKYPAAFSNFALPSLHGAIRSRDSPIVDGMSAFRDYQGSRNREMQPCSIDMKQPQDDVLAENEIQRRNVFNVASGIHVAGRGGVLFGGQCSSLSDPVAAIKMHYAKAEQHRTQGGSAVDDDRWTSSTRDVGR
ncbi:hypothetical protein C2S52_009161 [Perilla frutescens var. hirtella]|nr:hypothetical protein C2S52_009161 [Perilla frutescens var. hirtella]